MKVLVVTNDFPPRRGGIQTYIAELVKRLPDEVIVFTSSSGPADRTFDRSFPHDVIRGDVSCLLPTWNTAARVLQLIRSRRPDIVLFGAALPLATLGPLLLRRTDTPFGACTHGVEPALSRMPGGGALLRAIARRASFITTVSRWSDSYVRRCVGARTRVELLKPGVDTSRFHPGVNSLALRARLGLDAQPVVACVSRLVHRKGQDTLLRALPAVARVVPDVRCVIVGTGSDEARLRALADALGIASRVVFTGAVDDVDLPAYYRLGDVFTLPCRSRWVSLETEAFGIALLEAAAVGRPVIAGRTGGTGDAVESGETGVLVNGQSVQDVAKELVALLSNPSQAATMGERGAIRVQQEFSWDRASARLRELLTTSAASYAPSTASAILSHE